MKRILAVLLALCLVLCLAACGNEDTTSDITSDVSQTQSTTDTSSENESNTSNTESGAENTTSTPTNSETPSTTTKPTETHTHNWDWWRTETPAILGRDGTETRKCLNCKEVERRATTSGRIANSFCDNYLQEYFVWCLMNGSNPTPFDTSALFKCGDLIARDLCYDGAPEDIATSSIPVNDYYNALKQYFVLSDNVINQMKAARSGNAYPVTFDGFTPGPYYSVEGYIHNGGNKYTVYFVCEQDAEPIETKPFKVELEYNLLNGKSNRYISIEKVNSIPSNIAK